MIEDAPSLHTERDAVGAAHGWSALAVVMAPHLAQAAGPGTQPVSIALELAARGDHGQALDCRAWVERATRTLVFLGAEARTPDGVLAGSATAVFRRG